MQRTLLPALVAGLCAGHAGAEETYRLDEVVVTATRTARTADASLASVTVITRQDIERLQAQSVPELLDGLAGLSLSNNGGPGKMTSVYLRGTQAGHVLVLVDGVKVGSASLGMAAFQDLPLAQVERIEVVRGPRSSLYGSEAIGGVIQIFTRKGGGALRPEFSLGAGSAQTRQGSVAVSGGGARAWYSLGLSGFDTAGINARPGEEPDRDGYRNLSGRARLGYRLASGAEAEVNWLRAQADNRYDGNPDAGEAVQQVLSGRLSLRPTTSWLASLMVGQALDESDNFKDGVFVSRYDTRRDSVSWQNDLSLGGDQVLSLGIDYQDEGVASSVAYAATGRANTGVFVQYQAAVAGHDLQVSLRRDDNEQFGGHSTGALAWGHDLSDGLRVTASYGTAFKAPTFNDLYWPWAGNPDLRPERSASLELGLAGRLASGQWSLHAYSTRIDDLIDWACTANCGGDWLDDVWQPSNINQARIRGLEAAASTRWAGWAVRAALTLQDPENRSDGAYRGNVLPRRAERSLRLDLDRDFGACSVGATLRAEGRRYDDPANTVRLPGYGLVDLRGEYRFDKAWRLEGRVANLFDRDYQTVAGYNQPGRGVYLTLRWQP